MQAWATNNWMGFLIYAAVAIILAGLLQLRNMHKMMNEGRTRGGRLISNRSDVFDGFSGAMLRFVPVWILSVTGSLSFILFVVCVIVAGSK